jgi:hypothetical protein
VILQNQPATISADWQFQALQRQGRTVSGELTGCRFFMPIFRQSTAAGALLRALRHRTTGKNRRKTEPLRILPVYREGTSITVNAGNVLPSSFF